MLPGLPLLPALSALVLSLAVPVRPAQAEPVDGPGARTVQAGFATLAGGRVLGPAVVETRALRRRGQVEPGWFVVAFRAAAGPAERALLDELTGPVRREDGSPLARAYLPDDAYLAWVDGEETWRALRAAERVAWVARYEPGFKLDPALADATPGLPLELEVDLVPGHPPGDVLARLEARGARVLEHVRYRGRGLHDVELVVVEALPRTTSALAWVEGVLTVRPRAGDGLDGARLAALVEEGNAELVATLPPEAWIRGDRSQEARLLDLLVHDRPELVVHAAVPPLVEDPTAPLRNAVLHGAEDGARAALVRRARVDLGEGRVDGPGPSAALMRALLALDEAGAGGAHVPGRELERRVTRDVRAAGGFDSPDAAAVVLRLDVRDPSVPLRVALAWTDEPGLAGPGAAPVNRLGLVLRGPDGTGPVGEPGLSGTLRVAEVVRPAPGVWSVLVRPERGAFTAAQGWALAVAGDVVELGGPLALGGVVTRTLQVRDAWYSGTGNLGVGEVDRLRASDDTRFRVRDAQRLVLAFEQGVPADAQVQAIRVFVEHFEDFRVDPQEVLWRLGHGSLTAPTIVESAFAPFRQGTGAEGLDVWAPIAVVPDPNALRLVIENTSQRDDTEQDRVFVQVDYTAQPPQPPTITSTPSRTGVALSPWSYDANGAAEASGVGPLEWSVAAGPTGFSIHPGTGLVTWRPSHPGTFPVTLRVVNPAGADEQSFTVEVGEALSPPRIVSSPSRGGVVGVPYRYDLDGRLDVTGTGPFTFGASAPAGFGIDAQGVVGWTPSAPGSYGITVRAANPEGMVSQSFVVTVTGSGAPPAITSTPAAGALPGRPWSYDGDARASATGTPPIAWSLDLAPVGMAVDAATGALTWVPREAGTAVVALRAENDFGATVQDFRVEVLEYSVAGLPARVLPSNARPITYCPPERLAYAAPKPQQHLNVFLPPGTPPAEGWPVVLSTRAGGPFAFPPQPDLRTTGATAALRAFLEAGVAVVDFGVTGMSGENGIFYPPGHESGRYESFRPSDDFQEKEAEWAVQWLKVQDEWPLDPDRICTRGSSMGAIITLWATMGPERARATGSEHVRASTRVAAVVARHPPVSLWALDQTPGLQSGVVEHFERADLPGFPAQALGQVSEEMQRAASVMGFLFSDPAARVHNQTQPICLLTEEPVKRVNGSPADMTLDSEGFPLLHDTLGQPYIHDSWSAYVLVQGLIGLSRRAAVFHGNHSVLAVRDTTALPPPYTHTATFSGGIFGAQANAIEHEWVLRTLAVTPPAEGATPSEPGVLAR